MQISTEIQKDFKKYNRLLLTHANALTTTQERVTGAWRKFVEEFNRFCPAVSFSYTEYGTKSPILEGYTRVPKWMPTCLMDIMATKEVLTSQISSDYEIGSIVVGSLQDKDVESIIYYACDSLDIPIASRERDYLEKYREYADATSKLDFNIFNRTVILAVSLDKFVPKVFKKARTAEGEYFDEDLYTEYKVIALDQYFLYKSNDVLNAYWDLVRHSKELQALTQDIKALEAVCDVLSSCGPKEVNLCQK